MHGKAELRARKRAFANRENEKVLEGIHYAYSLCGNVGSAILCTFLLKVNTRGIGVLTFLSNSFVGS